MLYLYQPRTPAQKEDALHFRQNIRAYNSAFAFASFGGKIDHTLNRGGQRAPYVFKVNGDVYHQHGSLIPEIGETPAYAQIYCYDAAEATEKRLHNNGSIGLRRGILMDIH